MCGDVPEPQTRAAVRVERLTRRFGAVEALAGVDLEIARGAFFSLLGPSGCGKTTLLRLIAGLDEPDEGGIEIDGRPMAGVPANARPVNTVFQSYALFPHLTVRENIAFGLRMKRVSPPEARRRVGEAMDLLQIGELGPRGPAQLSGGQRQRVALARALVNEPSVLLLDEPMSALDAKLRKTVQTELRRLHRRLGTTFVLVTHDQEEALALSDQVALMLGGKIAQLGTPRELYDRPATCFAAEFLGQCNLLEPAALTSGLRAALLGARHPPHPQFLAIRPEKVRVSASEGPGPARVAGTLKEAAFSGAATQLTIDLGGCEIRAEMPNSGGAHPESGARLWVEFPPEHLIPLER